MKRSEPKWKRENARNHCKKRRDKIWDALAGKSIPNITDDEWWRESMLESMEWDEYDEEWDEYDEEWDFEDEQ